MLVNPPVIDRRLRDLSDPSRKLLGLIGLSRQQGWRVGQLLALLSALGQEEGYSPIEEALKAGMLFPDLPEEYPPLDDFTEWLGIGGALATEVFAHPAVAVRARGEELGLPNLATSNRKDANGTPRVADGLDWPLRLAMWQQVHANPVRFTQTSTLFKKRPDAASDGRGALRQAGPEK